MTAEISGPLQELSAATAHLRVYEPLAAFEDWAQSIILSTPKRDWQQSEEHETRLLWTRTLRRVSDPFPHDEPEFFRAVTVAGYDGTEHTRYCPGQLPARALLAAEQAEEAMRPEVFDLLVPPAAREANAVRLDTNRLAEDLTHLNTRTSSWGIPLSWFALFREDDEVRVHQQGDKLRSVRLLTTFSQAVERLSWALNVMVAHAAQAPLFEELGQLGTWLEGFDRESVLELDYGTLAELVWPDDSVNDLHHGLQALEESDATGAAAAYRRLSNRWLGPRHLGRAN